MAGSYGTFSILDTLAASNQTIAQFGVDRAFDHINLAFEAHNDLMRDMRSTLMTDTTDRLMRGGSYTSMEMAELDEFGVPDTQKLTAGANLGLPLRRYGGALQWSKLALKRMTTKEMAADAKGMMDADVVNFMLQMKKAFYRPTNYDFDDRLLDKLSAIQLPVKALANADSFPIPPGPNGETFTASSHTHYLVAASTSTFAAADMDALITTVREHYGTGTGIVAINSSDETTVRAFTKFRAIIDTRVIQANTATYVNPAAYALDVVNTNNRMIGIYDGFEVWVKPWALASYPLAWWEGAGVDKPLLYRYDPVLPSELQISFQGETQQLRADTYERFFGIGVWNRIGMAVLDVGHALYTSPV